jgi:hypothetical protein
MQSFAWAANRKLCPPQTGMHMAKEQGNEAWRCPQARPQTWGCEAVELPAMWLDILCGFSIGWKPPRQRIRHATQKRDPSPAIGISGRPHIFGCCRPVVLGPMGEENPLRGRCRYA